MGGLRISPTLSTSEARYNLFSVISYTTLFLLHVFYPELLLSANIPYIAHPAVRGEIMRPHDTGRLYNGASLSQTNQNKEKLHHLPHTTQPVTGLQVMFLGIMA